MIIYRHKEYYTFLFLLLFIFFSSFCFADGGPEPEIKVTDKNNKIFVYRPKQEIIWSISVESEKQTHIPVSMWWEVITWKGERKSGTVKMETNRHDSTLEWHYLPLVLGWHQVDLIVHLQDGKKLKSTRSFTVGDSPKSSGMNFKYGVSTHTSRKGLEAIDAEILLLNNLGVDIIRDEPFTWMDIEPRQGKWSFEKADRFMDKISKGNIELSSILAYGTDWASTAQDQKQEHITKYAPSQDAYVNYVKTVVDRYKDKVKFWEIWNEPDISFWLSSTREYTEMFDAASKAIYETDSSAKVMNGGFAFNKRMPNPDFIEDFTATADKSYWNIWAFHDYHSFYDLLKRSTLNKSIYDKNGFTVPIWQNEGGFHTLNKGGEYAQATTLVKKISTSQALGIKAYFWYDLTDDGTNPHETEHHFGLAHFNLDPKPSYTAYQTLIRELGGMSYARSTKENSSGIWGHLFHSDPDDRNKSSWNYTLVTWSENPSYNTPVFIDLGDNNEVVDIVDIMGNEIPFSKAADKDIVVVSLTSEPVYVHIKGERVSPIIESILDFPAVFPLVAGSSEKNSFYLYNPFEYPLSVRLQTSDNIPGAEWIVAPDIKLPAKDKVKVDIIGKYTKRGDTGLVDSMNLRITVEYEKEKLIVHKDIPITIAKVIPTVDVGSYKGVLKGREHIVNLYSAEPNDKMHWKGIGDLSGSFNLKYDNDHFYVEVEVQDDVHYQTDIRESIWQGDALQIAFKLNERDKDFFEISFATDNNGNIGGWVYSKPDYSLLPIGGIVPSANYTVSREKSTTHYKLRFPWKDLGLKGIPHEYVRFSFLVNDNDGTGRKQWLELTAGIGLEKNPDNYEIFVFR